MTQDTPSAAKADRHLWEVDHPYYCNESNFYSNECHASYKTWASFFESEGDSDPDMNLLFRFDWREGEDWGSGEYTGDDYYRNGLLQLFWVGQRKGLFRCTEIEVCRADEPAVREWLQSRFDYFLKLWTPFAPLTTPPETET